MANILEIRSYQLKPGTRERFAQLFAEEARPMLQRWQVDVVAEGPSLHDTTSYYLIRVYADLAARELSQNAFYGSDEWRLGPREAILACIETYTDVVLPIEEETLRALRALNA
jgi:hypothetical protein